MKGAYISQPASTIMFSMLPSYPSPICRPLLAGQGSKSQSSAGGRRSMAKAKTPKAVSACIGKQAHIGGG